MKRGIPFVLEKGGFSLKDEPAHGCMRGFTADFSTAWSAFPGKQSFNPES
jgi:hypothetical protein